LGQSVVWFNVVEAVFGTGLSDVVGITGSLGAAVLDVEERVGLGTSDELVRGAVEVGSVGISQAA
jgi:hypothetical protein